jgi:hypothetical protein
VGTTDLDQADDGWVGATAFGVGANAVRIEGLASGERLMAAIAVGGAEPGPC